MHNLQNVQIKIGSSFETVCPFPVGAIYQSTSSTSPASIYGGGWTPLTDGRFLRPQGSWNNLGGENEHTLTVEEMPTHRHGIAVWQDQTPETIYMGFAPVWSPHGYFDGQASLVNGGSQPHNNMPAYQTFYAWRRTN